jgi:hypothetical protein
MQSELGIIVSQDKGKYFIELKTFEDKNKAIEFAETFFNKTDKQVYLNIDSVNGKKEYKICLGKFDNLFSAGGSAFRYFSEKIIDNYKIIQGNKAVFDEFSNLIFVGSFKGNPSLYKYNIKSKANVLFWQKPVEKVIELISSKDTGIIFFLTAKNAGRKGIIPYIVGVNLYRLILNEGKVELLKELGDVNQLFTGWENLSSLKIVLNSFDKIISTYVNQRTIIFSTSGKIISDINKTFDLVKEDYPQLPKHVLNTISPDNKFVLVDSIISGKSDFYLKSYARKHFIFSTEQKLDHIEWTQDDHLIFSTNFISPINKSIFSKSPQTSTLTEYSAKDKKIINQWKKDGEKNFIIKSNFLYFDDGFGKKSKIFIYNLNSGQMIDTIFVEGGCGIKNIPYFPRFKQ